MITAGLTVSYKRDLLQGVHQPDDVYKMALYTEDAELSPATTHYTATEEVDATGTYEPGGMTLRQRSVVVHGETATLGWEDPVWTHTTLVARGALIYNHSREDRALAVMDFG